MKLQRCSVCGHLTSYESHFEETGTSEPRCHPCGLWIMRMYMEALQLSILNAIQRGTKITILEDDE